MPIPFLPMLQNLLKTYFLHLFSSTSTYDTVFSLSYATRNI